MKTNRTKRPLLRASALGTAAALALLAACEAKVPTGPDIEAMDVASASKAVAGTRMLQKTQLDSAIFYVDGRKVDAKIANSLAPEQIASIDVNKGSAQPVIRITTKRQAPAAMAATEQGTVRLRADTLRGVGVRSTHDSAAKKFDGLLLIDGVKSDQSTLATLDPKQIDSIEVIKGAAAEKLSSDPLAKNGIIKVTTRQ